MRPGPAGAPPDQGMARLIVRPCDPFPDRSALFYGASGLRRRKTVPFVVLVEQGLSIE